MFLKKFTRASLQAVCAPRNLTPGIRGKIRVMVYCSVFMGNVTSADANWEKRARVKPCRDVSITPAESMNEDEYRILMDYRIAILLDDPSFRVGPVHSAFYGLHEVLIISAFKANMGSCSRSSWEQIDDVFHAYHSNRPVMRTCYRGRRVEYRG